jgi:hypothetical protein
MRTISFKDYVKSKGYHPTKIWKSPEAFYANVLTTPKSANGFSNVNFDAKMVRLSFKDVDNEKIVGNDTTVVFESVGKSNDYKLKEIVRNLIEEIDNEEIEVEEATLTGNVAGYNTPMAFGKPSDDKKKADRLAKATGYSVVNESVKVGERYGDWSVTKYTPVTYDDLGSPNGGVIKLVNQTTMDILLIQNDLALRGAKWWISTKGKRVQDTKPDVVISKAIKLNESVNRYHQLRKDEGTPNQKIGKGMREMRKQIQEIEKFVEWYSKIKTEGDLDSSQYWKRTQKHLNVIRERLNKISQKIQNLSV